MAQAEPKTALPPYVGYRTFDGFLDRLSQRGIPQYVDRHYWGDSYGGSVGSQLMGGLRFLGLITDANEPTPRLERLVNPEDRKTAMMELLLERYEDVLSTTHLDRTTRGHLEREFGNVYRMSGSTKEKAVTFFVHAAQAAEMQLAPAILNKSKPRRQPSSSAGRQPRRRTPHPDTSQMVSDPPLPATPQPSSAEPAPRGKSATLTFPCGAFATLTFDVDFFRSSPELQRALMELAQTFMELRRFQDQADEDNEVEAADDVDGGFVGVQTVND